ncbi:epoxyqueuosine reductase QueH [Nanoarchaeota archaeon]
MKKKLLLHVCCGPCGTHSIEEMKKEYDVTAFWYNPNIHPMGEYVQRLEAGKKVGEELDIELVEGDYDYDGWLREIAGFEEEPEGGVRCRKCFSIRLSELARYAKENGFDCVTTTMTISPHKDADVINKLGKHFCEKEGIEWVHSNFKVGDGFKKSVDMSKKMGLYRQKFCGCFYSR